MNKSFRKILCLFLSVLLIVPSSLSLLAFAETPSAIALEYEGQKNIPVLEIDKPTVPEGIISDMEYGYNEPILHLTPGDGLWAEDLKGNAITTGLPNYVDLYVAQDDNALYLGIVMNLNTAHSGNNYTVDTFLGFGDSITDGATTHFKTHNQAYSRVLKSCVETIVTGLEGTGERLYSVNPAYEYPLPNWASIKPQSNNTYNYTFEAELNFKDSVVGSGKTWSEKPGSGYFSFDLGLFNGSGRSGTLHFATKDGDTLIPHVLNLAGGSADLSDLSVTNGGDLTPAFNQKITDYAVIVAPGELPNVKAIPADDGAKVEVLGLSDAYLNQEHDIQVKVSPANGAPGKVYNIHVIRNLEYEKIPATALTFDAVLEQIKETSWSAAKAIEILLSGTVESDDSSLLGLSTVFRTNGTKLPITINGGGTAVLNFNADTIASANDITFKNLSIPLDGKKIDFYAGAGNVVFENVNFGVEDGKGSARFYGDTPTLDVFAGWTDKEFDLAKTGKTLATSITFKGDTRYVPAQSTKAMLGAVGFDGEEFEGSADISLSPKDLSASFVIDGATVSHVGARPGTAPVSEANVTMLGGSAQTISGDGMTSSTKEVEKYKGKTYITVSGGTIAGGKGIVGLTTASHEGDLYVTVSQTDNAVPSVISSIKFSDRSDLLGSAYLSLLGGVVNGDVMGGSATITAFNTIVNTTINGSFYGASNSARRIVNQVSGATIGKNFVGGLYSGGICRGITNTLDSVTIGGDFMGANRSATLYGSVQNALSSVNVTGKIIAGNGTGDVTKPIQNTLYKTSAAGFFGGNLTGNVDGNIQNIVNGGTFTLTAYDEQNPVAYAGGCGNGTVNGDIRNTLTGVAVKRDFGGANVQGTVKGDVINNIGGSCSFAGYMGGSSFVPVRDADKNIILAGATIEGNVINTISAEGTAIPGFSNRNAYGAEKDGYGVAYFGGSRSGDILGTVQNTVNAGNFASRYFGGGYQDNIGADENGVSITNVINGGTFSGGNGYHHNGATHTGTMAGNSVTTINGGTFNRPFAGGSRSMADRETYTGTFYTTINGGNFVNGVYGGTHGHNATQQAYLSYQSQLTINGGTFSVGVYGGGKGDAPMIAGSTLIVHGGTFNCPVHPGSESNTNNQSQENNFSTLIIEKNSAIALEFNGTVGARDAKEKVELVATNEASGIVLGPNGSVTIDDVHTSLTGDRSNAELQVFVPQSQWSSITHVYLKKADTNEFIYSDMIRLLDEEGALVKETDTDGFTKWTGKAAE